MTPSVIDLKRAATAPGDALLAALASDRAKGLTHAEAAARLAATGPNEVPRSRKSAAAILKRQLASPFIYLLGVAALVAFATGERIDGTMIALFALINTGLGFFQEFRAERAVEVLMHYWQDRTHVVRDGKTQLVAARELVPGDIVRLQAGDKVPADVRFLSAENLGIDESILTGESVSVTKEAKTLASEPNDYFEATNIGFYGTAVLTGEADAVVFATGMRASLGEIARMTTETKTVSAFEKEIAGFSGFIIKLVSLTLVAMFALNIALKGLGHVQELLLFSIALTVGVIPEALPVVSTIAMSRGALRMAKKKVIVKRLSAINDLGSIDVLCTDKTGTITQNQMGVSGVDAADPDECVRLALLGSSFLGERQKQQNNAFDVALWKHASRGARAEAKKATKVAELPFDPQRRRNTVLIEREGERFLVMRGAPEEVLPLCQDVPDLLSLGRHLADQGHAGNRVLAVAVKRDVRGDEVEEAPGFAYVGSISFRDPLKKDAKDAAKRAKALGVQLKILTGDSREVAGAVAHDLHLIESHDQVLTGAEFDAMSVGEKHAALDRYHVFARVNPSQKFTIISLLQEKYAVGFLGEGFNDAPGLKLANVGLAVEGASDIAREAADVILLGSDLTVILDGIEEGRRTFANTIKYLKVTLASNFGNFYAVATASLFIEFLPMLPLQILLVNLLTDFPMIAIAADTVDVDELKKPSKYDARHVVLHATLLGIVSTAFDFLTFSLFMRAGERDLQTLWFIESNLTELALIWSLRTYKPFWKAARPPASVFWLTATGALATVILPFTAVGQEVFRFARPAAQPILVIAAIVACYFAATETVKRWLHPVASRDGERLGNARA